MISMNQSIFTSFARLAHPMQMPNRTNEFAMPSSTCYERTKSKNTPALRGKELSQ